MAGKKMTLVRRVLGLALPNGIPATDPKPRVTRLEQHLGYLQIRINLIQRRKG